MMEEMLGEEWRKAIPESRDQRQSRALVWMLGTILAGLCGEIAWRVAGHGGGRFAAVALAVSAGFVLLVRRLRAATWGGAVCGGMICLLLTFWTGLNRTGAGGGSVAQSGLTPLALLFVMTFLATRAGRQKKARAGLAEARRGRNAAQVIANLSVAGVCVALGLGWVGRVMGLAALVEATADTVSSEIGQAFGGEPMMLTTLRRVAPGTDGAVTAMGTAAGVLAGAVVAAVGMWALGISWGSSGVAWAAGVLGLLFDSVLGATVERRGWVGNDLVNFASTVFAALVAGILSGGKF